jgi:acetate kinase
MPNTMLAINAGSSSIKFALFDTEAAPKRGLSGTLERIGTGGASLSYRREEGGETSVEQLGPLDRGAAVLRLSAWMDRQVGLASIGAIGHRLVHGGPKYGAPVIVTAEVLAELHRVVSFAPEHLPAAIELIEHFGAEVPDLPQIACFDTSFHWEMPRVAKLLALPRHFEANGLRRYGFHGLSCAYLMEELARRVGAEAAAGRVILAHLGNGASLTAVANGKSIDTSMGFTPAAGIPMSTRSGDLDPGLVLYFGQNASMSAAEFNTMINHLSGLLGVSETSSDMRDLLAKEADDPRAAEAVALFCYQAKKFIGAYAAALGGVDTLVFAGGIGEHASPVRARICDGLGFLGIVVDPQRNLANAPLISPNGARVSVHVIATNEELMIAKATSSLLGVSGGATLSEG